MSIQQPNTSSRTGDNDQEMEMNLDPPDTQRFDPTQRNTQLTIINELVFYLVKKFENEDPEAFVSDAKIDVDRSNAYAGILATMYLSMRKSANTDEAKRGKDYRGQTCDFKQGHFSVGVLCDEFKAIMTARQLKWDFQLATPLVDVLTAFKMSWDEARMSSAKISLVKRGQPIKKGIKSFGLSNCHLPLLTGLTYKPERRAGLMRTLGPLTLAILTAEETGKWDKSKKAFKESIKHLPMADSLAICLGEAKSAEECSTLLSRLGDLLLILGSRSSNKFYFPLLFFSKATVKFKTYELDFSGKKGFAFWNNYSKQFTWTKMSKGTPEQVSQTIFHGIFGTCVEDLGILAQITDNRNWLNRKQLDNAFIADKGAVVTFTPIQYLFYSKMAAATMMKGSGTTQPMLTSKMVFSGSRKREYSRAFLEYLESGSNRVAYGTDMMSLAHALQRTKESYINSMRSEGLSRAGTTKWVNAATGQEVETVFAESGNYYFT